jgi:hypothetical protein
MDSVNTYYTVCRRRRKLCVNAHSVLQLLLLLPSCDFHIQPLPPSVFTLNLLERLGMRVAQLSITPKFIVSLLSGVVD